MMRFRFRVGSVSEYEAGNGGQGLWRIEAKPVSHNPDTNQYLAVPNGSFSITALRERPQIQAGQEIDVILETVPASTTARR